MGVFLNLVFWFIFSTTCFQKRFYTFATGVVRQGIPNANRTFISQPNFDYHKAWDEMSDQERNATVELWENWKERRPMRKTPEDTALLRSLCYLKISSADGTHKNTCVGRLFFHKQNNSIEAIGQSGIRREYGVITTADCFLPKSLNQSEYSRYIKPDRSGKWVNFQGTVSFACNAYNNESRMADREISLVIGSQEKSLVRILPDSLRSRDDLIFNNLALLLFPNECQNLVKSRSPRDSIWDYLKPFDNPFTRRHPSRKCKVVGYDTRSGEFVLQPTMRAETSQPCSLSVSMQVDQRHGLKMDACMELTANQSALFSGPSHVTWGPTVCILGLGMRWETVGLGAHVPEVPKWIQQLNTNAPRALISAPLIENAGFLSDAMFQPISSEYCNDISSQKPVQKTIQTDFEHQSVAINLAKNNYSSSTSIKNNNVSNANTMNNLYSSSNKMDNSKTSIQDGVIMNEKTIYNINNHNNTNNVTTTTTSSSETVKIGKLRKRVSFVR